MRIGYIGLGKMGSNMVERLRERRHDIVVFDRDAGAASRATQAGAIPAASLAALCGALKAPRMIWIMVPHAAVDGILEELAPALERGDTVIDGGNSPYEKTMRRASELAARGVQFLDVGVSGGPDGARNGACLMVGGERNDYERLEPLLRDIAAPDAYGYVGMHGAGHFVKMIHNGIEYGMMQAIAEGFSIMRESEFGLDLEKIANVYNHQSVITSRLVGWLADAYREFGGNLAGVSGTAAQSGEGLWTVEAAREFNVPAPAIEAAVAFRKETEAHPNYAGKILSALRNRFGGHNVKE